MEEEIQGPKTEIEDKVKMILKLIKDGDLVMDGTLEEILKREPLAELVKDIGSITNELNVLQNKVESLQQQKSDLEAQNVKQEKLIEVLREKNKLMEDRDNLVSTVLKENSEKKAKLFALIEEESDNKLGELKLKNIELEEQLTANERELNTLKQKASDYENQISANENKIRQLAQENLEQEEKLDNLGKGLSARMKECSALQRKLNTADKDASGKITAITAKVDNLQKECEKIREEREKLREEKNELANQMDLQRTLNEDYKQVDSWFNECKDQFEVSNKKIEEIAEELRKWITSKNQMEDDLKHQAEELKRDLEVRGNETRTLLENVGNHEEKLHLSNQKLQNTEQLLSEKEESFRKVEEQLQQVQREFHERMEGIRKLMKGGKRPEEVDESER
ncbi:COP1-interactive protein [Trifolium repens]|nr:COP1-interactive protein [Trifolium repens]